VEVKIVELLMTSGEEQTVSHEGVWSVRHQTLLGVLVR